VIEALAPTWIEAPVLQPGRLYLELSGEDIRARAFLVSDDNDLCLRPDMTVPAVRAAFALPAAPKIIAYEGLVFRQQAHGSVREREFVQLGAEWLERDDAQDAAIIACALEACRAGGVEPSLRLGDIGIREGFIAACGLDESWAARVRAALDHPERLDTLAETGAREADPLAEAIAHLDAAHAEAALAALVARAGITPVGARPVGEIVERLRAKGARDAAAPPSAAQIAVFRALVEIDAADGLAQAAALARSPALADASHAEHAIARARARLDALNALTTLPQGTHFAPGLGRALAYYDGFVFELEAPQLGERASLGGGGRYNALARALWPAAKPASADLGAAGFALRPQRLVEAQR
jgi:ATP phosphoribosyltransferase regulatory subunit